MQYMHFNSSCAYCCVANLLELQGRSVTDIQLFREIKAEWILHYDEEVGAWQTGAMLQSGKWFDLALRPMGFSLQETHNASADDVLGTKPPFMVGLKTGQGGRHAHILIKRVGESLTFLNPHREGDGEPDFVTLSRTECDERLSITSTIGRLNSCTPREIDFRPILDAARENWHVYQEELTDFISHTHTWEDMMTARDPLFRALVLDGLEGARIGGHKEQEARLRKLQGQFLGALKEKRPLCLSEYLDGEDLAEAFAFYHVGPDMP